MLPERFTGSVIGTDRIRNVVDEEGFGGLCHDGVPASFTPIASRASQDVNDSSANNLE